MPHGGVVPIHHHRHFDRDSLLHPACAIRVHITDVDDLVLDLVHPLLDLAEYDGLVRTRQRAGQVLFVEPNCKDLSVQSFPFVRLNFVYLCMLIHELKCELHLHGSTDPDCDCLRKGGFMTTLSFNVR